MVSTPEGLADFILASNKIKIVAKRYAVIILRRMSAYNDCPLCGQSLAFYDRGSKLFVIGCSYAPDSGGYHYWITCTKDAQSNPIIFAESVRFGPQVIVRDHYGNGDWRFPNNWETIIPAMSAKELARRWRMIRLML